MNPKTLPPTRATFTSRVYQNVMEALVEEEIGRQIPRLPSRTARYLDPIDVAAHALNRLPPLYASTEKGKGCQERIGSGKLKSEIERAVRQALVAVQLDPNRKTAPLTQKSGVDSARKSLAELWEWLAAHHLIDPDTAAAANPVEIFRSALRALLAPHLAAMEKLESVLVKKYRIALEREVTYENVAEVVDEALARFGGRSA
jgi:hypothetical protein